MGDMGRICSPGWLTWAVAPGLRSYVGGLADGTVTVEGGAVDAPSGFRFPLPAQEHPDEGDVRLGGVGTVRLLGHGGMMNITLSHPSIELVAGGKLTCRSPWRDEESLTLHLASVVDVRTRGRRSIASVRLEEDGAELFVRYAVGSRMSEVIIDRT